MLAITGPTAVGKSSLAVAYAEAGGGEIVSVDSRQVYRGLDAGTAKPSAADRARVPHHLIDEAELSAPLTAGGYATLAHARIDNILSRGRVPVLVGGSTLYLEAIVHGLPDLPPVEATDAVGAEEMATPESRQALFEELRAADPRAAATLDPSKTQRLARFVGVLRTTGHPPSDSWDDVAPPRRDIRTVVIVRPREELYARIERRVDQMVAGGLVEENRRLLADGIRLDQRPLNTIGYQEVVPFLRGEINHDEMVRLIKRNTRRYAKRQLTWFRRRDAAWLSAEEATVDALRELDRD